MASPRDIRQLGHLGEQLGDPGRLGTVHRLGPRMVFKRYNEPLPGGSHLDALISWRQGLPPAVRTWLDQVCAWPLARFVDGDSTVGFAMPCAPAQFWADMLGAPHTRELQHLLFDRSRELLGIPDPGPDGRLRLVGALARVFAFFDQHGLVYADLSERNLLWSADPVPAVYLLDCDNITVPGGGAPRGGQATSRGWREPRVEQGAPPDIDSDRWLLGMFFSRVVFGTRRDPAQLGGAALGTGPSQLGLERLLARALDTARPRPRAAEWLDAVRAATSSEGGARRGAY